MRGMGPPWLDDRGTQEETREERLDEDDEQDHKERREIDPSRAAGGKQLAEGAQQRLGRAVEELHDRVSRVGIDPGDDRRDDHEPLDDGKDRENDVEDGRREGPPEVHAASRGPKRAVPRRTSVAPSSTAISKSWLIPIEISGSGLPSRSASRSRICASCRKKGRAPSGSAVNGGTDITPRRSRCGRARTAEAKVSASAGSAPDLVSSAPRLNSRRTRMRRSSPARSVSRRPASLSRSRLSTTEKYCNANFALLVWSGPISRHWRVGHSLPSASILAAPSATRFSPKRVSPARAAWRTVSTGWVFVTARRETPAGSRPARAAACAMRWRTSWRRAAIAAAESAVTARSRAFRWRPRRGWRGGPPAGSLRAARAGSRNAGSAWPSGPLRRRAASSAPP